MNRDDFNDERERFRRSQQQRNDRRERFPNDDYSRYASSDFREDGHRDYGGNYGTNRFDYRESGTARHPGVSGKSRDDDTWINPKEYNQQRNFMGKGPKGYKRTDDRIYEEVCEALMNSHEVNASEIGVKVQDGIVTLEGKVSSRQEKRLAEVEIEDLPGVLDVRNELKLVSHEDRMSGPEGAVKNDLGVGTSQNIKRA